MIIDEVKSVTNEGHRVTTVTPGPDLLALVALLELEVKRYRPSSYAGVELVLDWEPNYRVITVLQSVKHYPWYLYSKQEFPGAHFDGQGTWDLTI